MKSKNNKEIKVEVDDLNKLEGLSDGELNEITGGSGGDESIRVRNTLRTGHIPADEAKVGMYVYVSIDGEDRWYSGTITAIKEGHTWFFFSKRTFYVGLTGYNGYGASGDGMFESTDVTLYRDFRWA